MDTTDITEKMLASVRGVVGKNWPKTQKLFESETIIFAGRLNSIEKLHAKGEISVKLARCHVELQKEAWGAVLHELVGLNQHMVEQALNASIKGIREVVNKSIGFELL